MSDPMRPIDVMRALGALTPARVALGRSGVSQSTSDVLSFGLAHAQARDAVHAALDAPALREALGEMGRDPIEVASAAPDRAAYLARPDWGRRLDPGTRDRLQRCPCEVLIVLGDGLSATAVQRHAPALLAALVPRLGHRKIGPLVIAAQARVALADEIGECLGARLVVMLIGERPGLSSPDSLGAYLTANPRRGRSDAERNCISNIHGAGLGYEQAAGQIVAAIETGLAAGITGVALNSPGLRPGYGLPPMS
jgi:ethanolamine ammonia-lyase small subunit